MKKKRQVQCSIPENYIDKNGDIISRLVLGLGPTVDVDLTDEQWKAFIKSHKVDSSISTQASPIEVSHAYFEILVEAIKSPPEPNEKLREEARKFLEKFPVARDHTDRGNQEGD